MRKTEADVAVIGLGAMGSAALWRLAVRGVEAIGFEQFPIGHTHGSSHGETRLFRTLTLEAPQLVDVARRSQQLLRELEVASGEELLRLSGGLMIGTPESDVISGVVRAARSHGVEVQELSAREVSERFPQHQQLDARDVGIWDPESGAVRPEASITAAVRAAESAGATVYDRTAVLDITPHDDGVEVRTATRTFFVGRVIIAAGAWLSKFVPTMPLEPLRTPMTWFEPRTPGPEFDLERFPIFIRAVRDGQRLWGHGAVFGHGVKIGPEDDPNYRLVDPDRIDRAVGEADWRHVGRLIGDYLPELDPAPVRTTTCMITRSPDMQFQLGPLRSAPRVVVAGGDSGHAFKHATGLGEYLAQLTLGEEAFVDLSFTDVNRF